MSPEQIEIVESLIAQYNAGHGASINFMNYCREQIMKTQQPKMRKVKMLAWFDGACMFWRTDTLNNHPSWKRVPAEDKGIEIEK